MAALTSASFTIVVGRRDIVRAGRRKRIRGTLAFGNGADTYPAAGIPLPAASAFGFSRFIESLNLFGLNERTTDYLTRFGPTNKTLLMYSDRTPAAAQPLAEDSATAVPARTYTFEATGW